MQCPVNLTAIAALCVIFGLAMPCCCDPLPLSQESASRPARPKMFTSPEELRKYLEDLSDFYAYAGRPRFGKRLTVPAGFRSIGNNAIHGGSSAGPTSGDAMNLRYYPAPSDIYELLSQYDE